MADRVTYSNLFSEARNNLKDLLSIKTNVADPITGLAEYRKWIYSREPDVLDSNFKGYPYFIIHPTDIDFEKESTANMKSKFTSGEIEIEIITSDRGYSGKAGQGMTYMDSITNSIIQTLLNIANRKTLQSNGLYFIEPKTTKVSNEIVEKELTYQRSIMVGFQTKMQVSV